MLPPVRDAMHREPALPPPSSSLRREDAATPRSRALALFAQHEGTVRQVVGALHRRLPPNVQRDDLIAAGMAGLWDAVQRAADRAEQPHFEAYLRVRIRGAVFDELRAQDWLPRRLRRAAGQRPAGAPVVVRLDDVSPADQARYLGAQPAAEADVDARMERASLEAAVSRLPERERCIVAEHYFGGRRFKDVGRMLGVSEPRVSQLHSRALSRLRSVMQAA